MEGYILSGKYEGAVGANVSGLAGLQNEGGRWCVPLDWAQRHSFDGNARKVYARLTEGLDVFANENAGAVCFWGKHRKTDGTGRPLTQAELDILADRVRSMERNKYIVLACGVALGALGAWSLLR